MIYLKNFDNEQYTCLPHSALLDAISRPVTVMINVKCMPTWNVWVNPWIMTIGKEGFDLDVKWSINVGFGSRIVTGISWNMCNPTFTFIFDVANSGSGFDSRIITRNSCKQRILPETFKTSPLFCTLLYFHRGNKIPHYRRIYSGRAVTPGWTTSIMINSGPTQ